MKTAVSIPDEVFHEADRVAERLGWSRSQLYSTALRAFVESQGADPVTAALDELADELAADAPVPNAGRVLIERGEWEW